MKLVKLGSNAKEGKEGKDVWISVVNNTDYNSPIPWHHLSREIQNQFTVDGKIEKKDWYLDGIGCAKQNNFYAKTLVDSMIEKAQRRETDSPARYPKATAMLYECLDRFPIKNKTVAVIGSVTPWFEAVCLAFGGIPTTIEYNKLTTDDDRLNLMTKDEYDRDPFQFDAVLSMSSYEHDGLGRYGDPLDPDGDIKAMKLVKEVMLKKKGLLYLAVPIGKDELWWNAHRIYGQLRWPKLIDGFEMVYPPEEDLDNAFLLEHPPREVYQPTVVLENL